MERVAAHRNTSARPPVSRRAGAHLAWSRMPNERGVAKPRAVLLMLLGFVLLLLMERPEPRKARSRLQPCAAPPSSTGAMAC
jgi:hypothetical protein